MTSTPDSASSAECGEWGYLLKADKTGTRELKRLLRAVHGHIASSFAPTTNGPDLLPSQLAAFYSSLGGQYDTLFLSTPPATLAFIYKNLGCLHSLQPLPERRFSDPVIPALKVEGWIMWETIQLLLAPDEHAEYLIEAVRRWDLRDQDTGEPLPKVLPRRCFPTKPDGHMTLWYEGMSERLRREAEDEATMKITPVEEAPKRIEHRRERDHGHESDGGRSKALEYFLHPVGRKDSTKRGPTLMERGKSTATSIGHVVRNIGSPHLWDGGSGKDREVHWAHTHRREEELDSTAARRKSLPHHRGSAYSSRRGSAAQSPTSPRDSPRDRTVRHTKSHDGGRDYFPPYEAYEEQQRDREDMQGGFMPTASPLFATQIARGQGLRSPEDRRSPRSWDGQAEVRRRSRRE